MVAQFWATSATPTPSDMASCDGAWAENICSWCKFDIRKLFARLYSTKKCLLCLVSQSGIISSILREFAGASTTQINPWRPFGICGEWKDVGLLRLSFQWYVPNHKNQETRSKAKGISFIINSNKPNFLHLERKSASEQTRVLHCPSTTSSTGFLCVLWCRFRWFHASELWGFWII